MKFKSFCTAKEFNSFLKAIFSNDLEAYEGLDLNIMYYLCFASLCFFIWLLVVCIWTSLVAQWLRIHLPMQGTRVQSLVQEDPTCHGATKPVHHNY